MNVTFVDVKGNVVLHHEMECVPRCEDSIILHGVTYNIHNVTWRVFQAKDATKKENNAVITLETP